jgi:hypothetical protein
VYQCCGVRFSRKNKIRSRIIGSIERELTAAQEARLRDQEALRLLQAQRDAAQNRSDTAYIEAGRELDRLERLKGPGARYRDANRQHDVAERLKASTAAEINRVQASLKLHNARIEKLNDQLSLRSSELHARWQALESEKVRDPRWIAKRDDPLLRYMALQELKGDAVYGASIEKFDLLAKIVLVTFELMFLLIKVVFAPSSVYLVRLIAQIKLEAAMVAADYERKLSDIHCDRPRPNLRAVASNEAVSHNSSAKPKKGDQ